MDLDLDRMLENTRRGQWTLDDFDFTTPLQGAGDMSRRERREAGLALVFTAGLERQAARVFDLCAEYIDDERATAIYRLFAEDERRHAAAELELARRYGVGWKDQPVAVRWMFKTLARNWDTRTRALHEMSAATILLFELALDTLLIPALKERVDDPVQSQVFRRIDLDESRHLAMDYWLLDRKGAYFRGRELGDVLESELGPFSRTQKLMGRYRLYRTLVAFLVGFGANAFQLRAMRKAFNDPERIRRYLARVADVPGKAPLAMQVPAFRMGLRGQRIIMRTMGRITGVDFEPVSQG
jgi:hypothetical protein